MGICKKEEAKEKRDIKTDARRMSIKKNNAKKPFVTTASANNTSKPM